MTMPSVLITGAAGEIGHGLVDYLVAEGKYQVIALDLKEVRVPSNTKNFVPVQADILNRPLLEDLFAKYQIRQVFHLAAILSSGGEKVPEKTHRVNVDGSFNLLSLSKVFSQKFGTPITFVFPSTIAVYGIRTLEEKNSAGKVREEQFLSPILIYGASKLYIESLGRYFSEFYKLIDSDDSDVKTDFRSVRFPGLMSSETLPSGGTSDYGSEMIHSAAQGKPYSCFVKPETRLPFMAMPDAIRALIELSRAPKEKLTQRIYNLGAFSATAEEIRKELLQTFPSAQISYDPNLRRQKIVDSWPGDVDDSKARKDWGWKPTFGFESAFREYLIPGIKSRYSVK